VLQLHDAILLGGKGPKVVGVSNLFLVDESIVNERHVNVDNAVQSKKKERIEKNDTGSGTTANGPMRFTMNAECMQ
jgi:hypothetical protein